MRDLKLKYQMDLWQRKWSTEVVIKINFSIETLFYMKSYRKFQYVN